MNPETKKCQNCKNEFTIEPEDFAFYEKMKVPSPTFCWLCRAQRRLSFRNDHNLYKRKSDSTGQEIFSMYPPESPVKVYERDVWLSDQWDPLQYGREVDFSRPFLEQVGGLINEVPHRNLNVVNGIKSDYCNNFTDPKNCYLVFNGNKSEDTLYSHGLSQVRDCVDVSHVSKCENCYEGFWLTSCTGTYFSSQCENCLNVVFSKNCVGCNYCFGCVGLRNKSYHIFNQSYSKEDYEKKIAELDWSSYGNLQNLKKQVEEFWLQFPNKFIEGLHNTAVSGNYIDHAKNVKNSFLIREGENLKFCQYVSEYPPSKDCYDYSVWGDSSELLYECTSCGIRANNLKFCLLTQENVHHIEYSMECHSSFNLFGCVGMRKKEYCILNKQYSKEEYGTLAAKIIKHMTDMPYTDKMGRIYRYGEYFPAELSPWAYNETLAFDYFPLTKEEATAKGYNWRDVEEKNYEVTLKSEDIPDRIADVDDLIIKDVIGCAHKGTCNQQCTRAFRIIPLELEFYRKHNLPIPRLCPNCRTYERLKQRSGLAVYKRSCQCTGKKSDNFLYQNTANHFHNQDHCPNEFETSYLPEKPEIIYCETCYQAEVV